MFYSRVIIDAISTIMRAWKLEPNYCINTWLLKLIVNVNNNLAGYFTQTKVFCHVFMSHAVIHMSNSRQIE